MVKSPPIPSHGPLPEAFFIQSQSSRQLVHLKQNLKNVNVSFFFKKKKCFSGYGHIAPKTPWAKIVTIFYAILGIPLTVLCWSNIGDAMANAFRFCYWRICCYVCTKKPKKKKKRHMSRGGGRA